MKDAQFAALAQNLATPVADRFELKIGIWNICPRCDGRANDQETCDSGCPEDVGRDAHAGSVRSRSWAAQVRGSAKVGCFVIDFRDNSGYPQILWISLLIECSEVGIFAPQKVFSLVCLKIDHSD